MDMKYAFCNSDYKLYYLKYSFNSTYHMRTMLIILFAKLIILCVRNRKQGQKLISIFTYNNKKYPKTEILPIFNLKSLLNTSSLIKIFSIWTCAINLTLITIVNPGLKNPGPANSLNSTDANNTLKIHYQNVQGLIPLSCLSDRNPLLDVTKILELQTHVSFHKPDIIILNETWLKDTINNNEILSCNEYRLFRCDRTIETHPPDPDDPKKFRRNGGVLIAVRNDIAINTQRINLKCKVEFLAIELIMNDKSKVIVASCYRVGTLAIKNQSEITNSIRILLRKKKVKKSF